MMQALEAAFLRGSREMAVEMGREVLHEDMTTLHRAFLRFASPQMVLKSFGVLWGLYRRDGALEVTKKGPQSAVFIYMSGHFDLLD